MRPDLQLLGLLTVGVFLMFGGAPVAIVALLGLSIYALTGTKEALFCLLVSCLISILNKDLFSVQAGVVALLRWFVLLAASVSILVRIVYGKRKIKTNSGGIVLVLFLVVATTLANVYGYAPGVSNFKLFIFGFGGIAIMHGFLYVREWRHLDGLIFTTLTAVILNSVIILLVFPIQAFRRSDDLLRVSGFQGVTNQSQTLGVVTAMGLAWMIAKMVSDPSCRKWYWYAIAGATFVSMIASNARTGPIGLLVGGVLTLLFGFGFSYFRRRTLREIFRVRTLAMVTLTGIIVAANFGAIADGLMNFALKGGRNGTEVAASFEASRGFRIRELYRSFMEAPWTGKGFGLETYEGNLEVTYDPILKILPIKAPVEKNFLFLAIFEETGIIGGALFFLFIGCVTYILLKYRSPIWCFVFLTGIAMNLGESIFFSLGGVGLFTWVIMASAFMPRNDLVYTKNTMT